MRKLFGAGIAVILLSGTDVRAECPWANPSGADGQYVKSQYGRHIGRGTAVSMTPRQAYDHSHVKSGYGKHIGRRRGQAR